MHIAVALQLLERLREHPLRYVRHESAKFSESLGLPSELAGLAAAGIEVRSADFDDLRGLTEAFNGAGTVLINGRRRENLVCRAGGYCRSDCCGARYCNFGKQDVYVHGLRGAVYRRIARLAIQATGKPLSVVHVTDEQLASGLKAAGVPEIFVSVLVSADAEMRAGNLSIVTDHVESLIGRAPRPLAEYLKDGSPPCWLEKTLNRPAERCAVLKTRRRTSDRIKVLGAYQETPCGRLQAYRLAPLLSTMRTCGLLPC
jgi:hypothetical protein